MAELTGQVALITGAAGGIGSAIATKFVLEGAKVVLVDTNVDKLETLSETIKTQDENANILVVGADVTKSSELEEAVKQGLEQFGKLTSLVNAMGILLTGTLAEMAEETWDKVMAVNVKGVFLACRAAAPAIAKSGGGAIVNLSSVSAFVGSDIGSAYHTSKGAVLSLTYSLAQELAPANIRVNAICPGWVDAGFTHQAANSSVDRQALLSGAAYHHALGRMATAEEVAHAAVFLASTRASFVTGSPLFVDGGFMIKR
jgi:NAD(P)-dependent dehydrogenase (short-subunit alcohol dehydrogenase family)